MAVAALLTLLRIFEISDRVPVGTGPHRDPMPQPELPGDVPVADVAHPAQVLLAPAVGMESELVGLRHGDGRTGDRLHLHPPLRRDQWLDYRAAAIAVPDRVVIRLDLLQRAFGPQHLDDALAR